MNLISIISSATLFSFIIFFHHLFITTSVNGQKFPAPYYNFVEVVIICRTGIAFHAKSNSWFGQSDAKSRNSTAAHRLTYADSLPTPRISPNQFSYTFQVIPGQRFIRLNFDPTSCRGSKMSEGLFAVKSVPVTPPFRALGVNEVVKEICSQVGENNKVINSTFSFFNGVTLRYSAFVIEIEILPMPDKELSAQIHGRNNRSYYYFYFYNRTAQKMAQRLNIGGKYIISARENVGLLASYLSGFQPVKHLVISRSSDSVGFSFALPLVKKPESYRKGLDLHLDQFESQSVLYHKSFVGLFTLINLSILILVLVNVFFYCLRKISEGAKSGKQKQAEINKGSLHCFSFAEIISATQNFSEDCILGKGGFGVVYKGFICDASKSQIVAIKRLKLNSKQGANEFWTEIEILSELKHRNLVSLKGYCSKSREMILVYEYIPRGTLADNLYKIGRKGKNNMIPLTWEQRLRICIGAARGLDYLHTGIGVVHRDVKATNILLDEDFTAKISDFGLSKLEIISPSKSYMSTEVKGTFGYLDPNYFYSRKLTSKTDVYAFGVVLLVVLCGKPAVDTRTNLGEQQTLVSRFRECTKRIGDFSAIIDPSLRGRISSQSLREFVKTIENCLDYQPKRRPTMTQVGASLEYALEELQERSSSSMLEEDGISVPKTPRCWPWGTVMSRGKLIKKF